MRVSSRVTSQNQTSVPAAVRRKYHIAPGTELIWEDHDHLLVVRPKRFTLADIRVLCSERPVRRRSLKEMRAARDQAVSAKHAGRR